MNNKALHTLEFDKIIHRLIEKADSEPGKACCRSLVPDTDIHAIRTAQQETADALSRLLRFGSTSFGGNRDLGYSLKSLDIGSSLTAPELIKIADFLENTARIKAYGREDKDTEKRDSLSSYFDALSPLTPVSEEIRRCLLSEEEVADDASPALKRIRREIALTGEKIHSQLNSMVNGSLRTYLQDAVITMRDNRYCLPVKAEYKGQVSGMVHDQSSTGSTFFIEPAAVVELNNKLRQLGIAKLSAEINKRQFGQSTAATLQVGLHMAHAQRHAKRTK